MGTAVLFTWLASFATGSIVGEQEADARRDQGVWGRRLVSAEAGAATKATAAVDAPKASASVPEVVDKASPKVCDMKGAINEFDMWADVTNIKDVDKHLNAIAVRIQKFVTGFLDPECVFAPDITVSGTTMDTVTTFRTKRPYPAVALQGVMNGNEGTLAVMLNELKVAVGARRLSAATAASVVVLPINIAARGTTRTTTDGGGLPWWVYFLITFAVCCCCGCFLFGLGGAMLTTVLKKPDPLAEQRTLLQMPVQESSFASNRPIQTPVVSSSVARPAGPMMPPASTNATRIF